MTDTALATYLFAVIDRAVVTEAAAFRQLNPPFRGARLMPSPAAILSARRPSRMLQLVRKALLLEGMRERRALLRHAAQALFLPRRF